MVFQSNSFSAPNKGKADDRSVVFVPSSAPKTSPQTLPPQEQPILRKSPTPSIIKALVGVKPQTTASTQVPTHQPVATSESRETASEAPLEELRKSRSNKLLPLLGMSVAIAFLVLLLPIQPIQDQLKQFSGLIPGIQGFSGFTLSWPSFGFFGSDESQAKEAPQPEVKGLTDLYPDSPRLVIDLDTVFKRAVNIAQLVVDGDLTVGGDSSITGDQTVEGDETVEGDLTVDGDSSFNQAVNIVGELTLEGNVNGPGVNINIGSGSLTAGNVVYSVTAGTGISSSGGQNPTITNTDGGSAQAIFKNIVAGGNTITAGSNNDTLTFSGGTGVTLTSNPSNKTITISADGGSLNVSGWEVNGTTVQLQTITNNVGIGTTTPGAKLEVAGNSILGGNVLVSGTLTVNGGTVISNGINNQGGGITNAGAITGATGFTSSGTITLSGLSTGVVKAGVGGVLSASAVNLNSADVTGTLPATSGGTGLSTYLTGDILYSSASNTLARLGIGGEDEVLTVVGGVPQWAPGGGGGGPCPTCLIVDPGTTQTIIPGNATTTGLSIRQANGGSVDIFNVTNFAGTTKYLTVESNGNVVLGGNGVSSNGSFTVAPTGTDPIVIAPVAQGLGMFSGTITSIDLTDDRTWTFPDATGEICLSTGNCAGQGGNFGGSGTPNFIPKFATATTVTDSIVYDAGTEIGIGTSTPGYTLDVNGDFRSVGAGQFDSTLDVTGDTSLAALLEVTGATSLLDTLNVTGATTLSSTLGVTGNTTMGGTLSVASNLTVDTNTLFVNATTDRVGVGTLTPNAKLQVSGPTDVSGQVLNINNTSGSYFWTFANGGGPTTRIIQSGHNSAGTATIVFDPAGTSYFNTGGNVGIGTTSPSFGLQVGSTTNPLNFEVRPGTGAVQFVRSGVNTNMGNGTGGTQLSFANNDLIIGADGVNHTFVGSLTQNRTFNLGNFSSAPNAPIVIGRVLSGGTPTASYYVDIHQLIRNTSAFNNGTVYIDDVLATSGNLGVGNTNPTSLLSVGSSSQFQVNSSGNIVSIGGVAHTIADSSGNLAITSNGLLNFDDSNLTAALPLSLTDTSLNVSLPQGIVDAINATYAAATGGGGGLWSLTSGVIHPTTGTHDLAIGGTDSTADFFVADNGKLVFNPATTGTFLDFNLNSTWTTGNLMNADFSNSTTLTGAVVGLNLDLNTNVTGLSNASVTGLYAQTPALTANGTNTTNYYSVRLGGGALNTLDAANVTTINWFGNRVEIPNLNTGNAADTVNAYGLYVAGGSITNGPGAENMYGLVVDNAAGNNGFGTVLPKQRVDVNRGSIIASSYPSTSATQSNFVVNSANGGTQFFTSESVANAAGVFSSGIGGSNAPYTIPTLGTFGSTGLVGSALNAGGTRTAVGIYGYTSQAQAATLGTNSSWSVYGLAQPEAITDITGGNWIGIRGVSNISLPTTLNNTPVAYGGWFSATAKTGGNAIGMYATATGGNNNYAAIFDAGNVGIGTTTPGARFHVNLGSNQNILFQSTGGVANIASTNDAVSAHTPLRFTADGYRFFNAGSASEIVTFLGSGNVGIGATSPASRLDVVSSGTNTDVQRWIASDGSRLGRFTETSGGHGWFEVDNASGTAVALFRADGGNSYISSGNFGLGTTSPTSLFSVGSSSQFQVNSSGNIVAVGGAAHSISDSTGLTLTSATSTLNLQPDGSINVNIAGGSGATGCTIFNSTGNLTCTGDISGASSGNVGYWNRNVNTLSPSNANDIISYTSNNGLYSLNVSNTGGAASIRGTLALTTNSGAKAIDGGLTVSGLTNNNAVSVAGSAIRGYVNLTGTNTITNVIGLRSSLFNTSPTSTLTNWYGLYAESPSNSGTLTNNYPIFIPTQTGATNNYAFVSESSTNNVGIGTITPTSLFSVGSSSQFQVNSSGNIVAVGGAAHSIGNSSGNLAITSNGLLNFDDSNLTTALPFSLAATSLNAGLTQGVVDALNDLYTLATTGGGSSIWSLTTGVIHPTTLANNFTVGGNSIATSMFGVAPASGGFYFGANGTADPVFNFKAASADTATFGFTSNDNFYFMDGRVAIGNNTAATQLDVYGSGATFRVGTGTQAGLYYDNNSNDLYVGGNSSQAGNFFLKDSSGNVTTALNSDSSSYILGSNLGIGTTTPVSLLSVGANSEFQVNSSGNIVNIGGAAHSIANSSGALNIDSATTGAINLGTGANAKTITIGNNTGATALNFTSGTGSQTFTSSATTNNAFAMVANALTTGRALNVTSTSTALTTGGLGVFDWSPGSATTATGDLVSLNVGANGTIGNIFNVKNAGSSVFSISQTQIVANLPVSFNAPGNIISAYDMLFSNQTASNIISNAPLSIIAGESFESNNLTLGTYNSGKLVLDTPGGTITPYSVGIGNTAPNSLLQVGSDITAYSQTDVVKIGNNLGNALGLAGNSTASNINFYVNGAAARVATLQAGRSGTQGGTVIWYVKPDSAGDVQTAMTIGPSRVTTFTGGSGTCTVTPGVNVACSSDERLKHNIAKLSDDTDALTLITKLQPVKYDFNTASQGTTTSRQVGFLAQDVERIMPELISTDIYGYKAMNYAGLTPVLVAGIQAQQSQILGVSTELEMQKLRLDTYFLTLDGQLADSTAPENQEALRAAQLASLEARVGALEHQASTSAQVATGSGQTVISTETELDKPTGVIANIAEWTQDAFTFLKDIIIKGAATFEGRATFLAEVVFKGRIVYEDKDTAGTIEFEPGEQLAEVEFENAYTEKPIITLTAENGVEYVLYDVTANGFKVSLMSISAQTSVINWQAISVKEATVTKALPAPNPLEDPSATGSAQVTQASGSAVLGVGSVVTAGQ